MEQTSSVLLRYSEWPRPASTSCWINGLANLCDSYYRRYFLGRTAPKFSFRVVYMSATVRRGAC